MLSIFILTILGPVTIMHLWLHGMLPFWRRYPWLHYVFCLLVWVLAFFFFRTMHDLVDIRLGLPAGLNIVGAVFMIFGAVMALMGFIQLGFKRFFWWVVLRPSLEKPERVIHGIFSVVPHPTYIGYLLVLLGNILVHDLVYTVPPFVLYLVTIPVVMWLEEHELAQRTT